MSKETIDYILFIIITLVIAIVLSLILRKLLNAYINKYAGKLRTDHTNFLFIINSVGFLLSFTALIFIFIKRSFLKEMAILRSEAQSHLLLIDKEGVEIRLVCILE